MTVPAQDTVEFQLESGIRKRPIHVLEEKPLSTLSPSQLDLQVAARELAESEFRPRAAEIDRTEQVSLGTISRS